MNLTLGVHGPKFQHAILFDDTTPDYDEQIHPSDFFDDDLSDGESFDEEEPGAFDDEDEL
jgi:hypothetical protein